jgi:hypothetical protein
MRAVHAPAKHKAEAYVARLLGISPGSLELYNKSRPKSHYCEVDVYVGGCVIEVKCGKHKSTLQNLDQLRRNVAKLREFGYVVNEAILVQFRRGVNHVWSQRRKDGIIVIYAPACLVELKGQ